jgi:hypothetical protein
MIRTFSDHKKQSHSLNLDTVQVDGAQCISIQATEQYIQFEMENQQAVTCELAQFWREIAGPDLSAQEAGLLLAECLVRQVVIQRTSSAFHEVMCLLTRTMSLPAEIPSAGWLTTRLDPLAQQAMSAYDGSDAMTDMLARILQREPETIHQWARQLGLDAPDIQVETEPLPAVETLAETEARQRFLWSSERLQQLEQALSTCNGGGTVLERARQIADQCGWPVEKVRSKLYEMRSLDRHAGQPTARESAGGEPEKEGDQHAEQRIEAVLV